MKSDLTEIAFVLDRSGSMESVAPAAIAGFNEFLSAHQSAPGQARLTLVLFDDEYLVPAASLPISEVLPLDVETYVPRNTTALLDAIGRTIDELGARLDKLPEAGRPGAVIVAVLTDGLENASTQYKWADVASRIRHQQQNYQWKFLFLGANQDAIATAAKMNISQRDSATINAADFDSGARAAARKSSSHRTHITGGRLTPSEQHDLSAPLQELADDEANKKKSKSPGTGSSK
ncbi:hypothetical protein AYO41_04765 [Verrucomicrobia bacterium SCGC AG-212-E04]|nr:hypothetical protein AYO41_04765 [Verrucomicrobia bacterium SCGC AG-212-E04]